VGVQVPLRRGAVRSVAPLAVSAYYPACGDGRRTRWTAANDRPPPAGGTRVDGGD
jgi:hypothetical protein